jgi:MoaA/NifB/PqqE/SkfB family radical SAM enzyme
MALDQVFLYVTQKCNIRCVTCYALDQLERAEDLSVDQLLTVLGQFRAQAAWKLSILGGEPTVHPQLTYITSAARAMGFRFVRINTNGMFKASFLEADATRSIDVICFSIDGATPAVNDAIRKGARLERIIANMQHAAALGYDVRANMTVTSRNIHEVFEVIALVERCGSREINLNVMFEMGYAEGREDLAVPPDQWLRIYDEVVRRRSEFAIGIKIPLAYAAPADLRHHQDDGHRCVAFDGSRRYVASNGDVFPCLAMMDDRGQRLAEFANGSLSAIKPMTADATSIHDYCHFIRLRTDGLRPLCLFHKTRLNSSAIPAAPALDASRP